MKTFALSIFIFFLVLAGCRKSSQPTPHVVLYTSVDEPFVRPLIDQFKSETGIDITLVTDAEATKTAGLAEKLLAEKDHPTADVYWGNEPFHTIRLTDAGALAPYHPPAASEIAARFIDKQGIYTPVGLRARVIAISTRTDLDLHALGSKVKSLKDLADPALKGKIAMSNPGFGTASGHVAALYLAWGDKATDAWLQSLADNNVALLGGNSVVATQVSAGGLVAGLTDNDDVANEISDHQRIEPVMPQDGTLLMPTTVALVKGAPHEAEAKRLIDFLTTARVEKQLIDTHFLAYSARSERDLPKSLDVDLTEVARRMPAAVERSLKILQRR